MNITELEPHGQAFVPSVPTAFLFFIFGTGTVFGNGLTIVAAMTFSSLRTGSNLCIISLAGADALIGVLDFFLGFISSPGTHPWFHGSESSCIWRTVLVLSGIVCSSLNVTLIAVDRFFHAGDPDVYAKHFTDKRIKTYITTCWVLAVMYGAIPLVHNNFDEIGFCIQSVIPWVHSYRAFLTSTVCAICCSVTITAYIRAGFLVTTKTKRGSLASKLSFPYSYKTSPLSCTNLARDLTPDGQATLKMFAVVCSVFVVCCTPLYVAIVVESYTVVPEPAMMLFLFLVLLNSGFNFFIYPYYNARFRKAIKAVLCCKNSRVGQS